MMLLKSEKTTRACLMVGGLVAALAIVACNESSTSPLPQAVTLFVYADYANPNVTVSVNGSTLAQITKQYTASTDCSVLITKGAADGVYSFPARLNQHYSINWTYSNGTADADSVTIDSDLVQFTCLFEPIEAPLTASRADRSRLMPRR